MSLPSIPGFAIDAELGQGGMSVVYRARREHDGCAVALKLLHEAISRQPDARARLLREAEATRRLGHPGVVRVLDVSPIESERAYLVSELVEGETLRAFVDRRGPPGVPELAGLVILHLADILRSAHAQGIVHRDLKPENVMITERGSLKLMDFGIAQLADAARLTVTGSLVGSPAHMAPEVIDGARADPRSDVFSLGTIYFWLLTGQLPFEAETASALFKKILGGEHPDPQDLQPALGNGQRRVLEQMLAREPSARLADAGAAFDALDGVLAEAGLARGADALARWLSGPAEEEARVRAALVERLGAELKEAQRQRNSARAVDRARRLGALAPELKPRLAHVLERRRAGSKLTATLAAALGASVVVGAALVVPRSDELAGLGDRGPEGPTGVPAGAPLVGNPGRASGPTEPFPAGAAPSTRPAGVVGTASAGAARAAPSGSPGLASPIPAPSPPRRSQPSATLSPSPTPRARPGPTSAPGGEGAVAARPSPSPSPSAPRPADRPPDPALATLRIRIGSSFANVRVDDAVVARNVYEAQVKLAPGRHRVWIEKPGLGRHRPATLDVTEEGQIFELRAEGAPRRVQGELSFVVPRRIEDAPMDWVAE